MFERFTDRSRKILAYATTEAEKIGADCVGTEHLLLGMIKEGSGIAASVLDRLRITTPIVYDYIEKFTQPGSGLVEKLPYSPAVQKIFNGAIEEAAKLKHNYVGTEHLLLALLEEKEGGACDLLNKFAPNAIGQLKENILNLLGVSFNKFSLLPGNKFPFNYVKKGEDVIGIYFPTVDTLELMQDLTVSDLEELIKVIRSNEQA